MNDEQPKLMTMEEMQREYAQHVLSQCDGNKTRAARALGIDRRTLYRLIAPSKTDRAAKALAVARKKHRLEAKRAVA